MNYKTEWEKDREFKPGDLVIISRYTKYKEYTANGSIEKYSNIKKYPEKDQIGIMIKQSDYKTGDHTIFGSRESFLEILFGDELFLVHPYLLAKI